MFLRVASRSVFGTRTFASVTPINSPLISGSPSPQFLDNAQQINAPAKPRVLPPFPFIQPPTQPSDALEEDLIREINDYINSPFEECL